MAQQQSNADVEKNKFYLLFRENRFQREPGYKPPDDIKTYRQSFQDIFKKFTNEPHKILAPLEKNLFENPTKEEIKIATKALEKASRKRVPINIKIKGDSITKKNYRYPPELGGKLDDSRRKVIRDYFTTLPLTSKNVTILNRLAYNTYLGGGGLGYYVFSPFTKEEIAHTLDDIDFNSSLDPNTDEIAKGWRCSAVQDGVKLPPTLKSHFTPSTERRMNPFMVEGSVKPDVDWETKRQYFKNSRKYCREYKKDQNKRRRLK